MMVIIIIIQIDLIIYCLYWAKILQISSVKLFASYFCFEGGSGGVLMNELSLTRCVEDIHQVINVDVKTIILHIMRHKLIVLV